MAFKFQPNTTIYLCAGTGMDMTNSIWWHRFAYPDTDDPRGDNSWWNTCFQFFKAHSIAEGHWYYTMIDPTRGYFDVGRTPLAHGAESSDGEPGLGNSDKQSEMDNVYANFADTIRAVDYVCFSNDSNGDEGFTADVQYAFVTKIATINQSVARVFFTIDAIMTYQKFFCLGPCNVLRDMQFNEWLTDYYVINISDLNTQPEPYAMNEEDFVFQHMGEGDTQNNEALQATKLGDYTKMFVTSDVSLEVADITPNEYYGGMPSFKMTDSTKVGEVGLGIGLYSLGPDRKTDPAMTLLGSYNAMEHILNSYTVPSKITSVTPSQTAFVPDVSAVIAEGYKNDKEYIVHFPMGYTDDVDTTLSLSNQGYIPLNPKINIAPFTYFSITDKQGSSIEVIPQELQTNFAYANVSLFEVRFNLDLTIAPNIPSCLYIVNSKLMTASKWNPFMTLWQMPAYAMTPNASGYNSQIINAIVQKNAGFKVALVGGGMNALTSAAQGAVRGAGDLDVPVASAVSGAVTGAVGGAIQPFVQLGSQIQGFGTSQYLSGMMAQEKAKASQAFGLPKAVGGLPSGFTQYIMNNPGYEFFFCHLKTELIKNIDYMMSAYGYAQNKFRYPHINTRRRWTFVQLGNVNILPIAANNYDNAGVPFEMRKQISDRLTAGITFWNMRHAIMGDGDSGQSSVTSYTQIPENALFCKWIKNYGDGPDSDECKENRDTRSYAPDYSDKHKVK